MSKWRDFYPHKFKALWNEYVHKMFREAGSRVDKNCTATSTSQRTIIFVLLSGIAIPFIAKFIFKSIYFIIMVTLVYVLPCFRYLRNINP